MDSSDRLEGILLILVEVGVFGGLFMENGIFSVRQPSYELQDTHI